MSRLLLAVALVLSLEACNGNEVTEPTKWCVFYPKVVTNIISSGVPIQVTMTLTEYYDCASPTDTIQPK